MMNRFEQEIGPNEFEIEPDDASLPDGSTYRWQPWPSSVRVREQLARLQRHWRWISALLALLVITLSLAGAIPTPAPSRAQPPVVIKAQQDEITCLQTFTWSPDGKRLALLGYWQGCPVQDYSYKPGMLNIYSADTGQLLRKLQPDTAILQALQQLSEASPSTSKTAPLIFYTAILWSRQAQQLALTFSIWLTPPPSASALDGVLLLDENGGHARVLLQPMSGFTPYNEWDVQQGSKLPARFPLLSSTLFFANLPTAPAYHWGSHGVLLPEGQTRLDAPPSAPPLGPIGNPIGDTSFTFWQSGRVELITSKDGPVEKPGVYLWYNSFGAWSPDGRYLVDSLSLAGRMQPEGIPAPKPQTLLDFNVDQLPLLAVRDTALFSMLQTLLKAPAPSTQSLAIAWRPDGRVLAAYGYSVNSGVTVNLYDCATGQQLVALPPAAQGDAPSLLWSPDGSRLLMQDGETITIWQPDLPSWL